MPNRSPKLPDLPEVLDTPEFRQRLTEWFSYKGSKAYKPAGKRAMISRAANRAKQYGVAAVCDAMERAMANGWAGWDFEQSFRQAPGHKADPRGNRKVAEDMLQELRSYGIETQ